MDDVAPERAGLVRHPKVIMATDKKVILVAEDDDSVREMIVRALEKSYTVYAAPDGMAASELLATIPTPSVIMLDVMMPKIDGLTLARLVKADERLKAVPLIFLTAKTMPGDVMQGIAAGARHYVQKPFKLADLLDKVARCMK